MYIEGNRSFLDLQWRPLSEPIRRRSFNRITINAELTNPRDETRGTAHGVKTVTESLRQLSLLSDNWEDAFAHEDKDSRPISLERKMCLGWWCVWQLTHLSHVTQIYAHKLQIRSYVYSVHFRFIWFQKKNIKSVSFFTCVNKRT